MTKMLKGIAASDGVAVKAYLLIQPDLSFETVSVEDMEKKLRLDAALKLHKTSFLIWEKCSSKPRRSSASFDAHSDGSADPEMIGQIKETIRTKNQCRSRLERSH